eukprot:SM000066S20461  [mRNA]  locus=s66:392565:395322:- [translate_table: standard]
MPHSASAFVTTSRDRIINVGTAVSSRSSGAEALRGSLAGESIQPKVVPVQERGPIQYHQHPHTASHAPRAASSAAVSQHPLLVGHASRSTSAGAGGAITPALLSAVVPGRSKGHDGRFLRSGSTGPIKVAGEGGPSHSSPLALPSAPLPSGTPAPPSALAGASLQRPASALGIPSGAVAPSGSTHPGAPQQHAIAADASTSGLLRSQSMSAAAAARPLHQSQQDGSAGSLSSGSLQSSNSYRGAMASSSGGGTGNQHGSGRRVALLSPAASMPVALAGGGGGVSGGGGSGGSSTSSQSTSGAQYKQPSVASVAAAGGEIGRPIASKAELAVSMSAASSASPMRLAAATGPSGADLKGGRSTITFGTEKSAYFFCLEDRALLCRDCDLSIHVANSLSASHRRYLLTGVRVALEALPGDGGAEDEDEGSHQAVPGGTVSKRSEAPPAAALTQAEARAVLARVSAAPTTARDALSGLGAASLQKAAGGSSRRKRSSLAVPASGSLAAGQSSRGATTSGSLSVTRQSMPAAASASDLLSEAVPSWRVEELLDIPELADGYTIGDIASSKADMANLGDFDWMADLSLFDEHMYAESLAEVPSLPSSPPATAAASAAGNLGLPRGGGSGSNAGGYPSSALRGKARHDLAEAAALVPDFDDSFVVPDLGLAATQPPTKRHRSYA